jgi:hypothetical protein
MNFKNVRIGDEVILATSKGHGSGGGFTYTLAVVDDVKSAIVVVDGFKFKRKDGEGRTVPHQIYPADAANRRLYLGDDSSVEISSSAPTTSEQMTADEKLRRVALDALRIIRDELDSSQDEDVMELIGVETLAAFHRQWRKLHADPN